MSTVDDAKRRARARLTIVRRLKGCRFELEESLREANEHQLPQWLAHELALALSDVEGTLQRLGQ